MRFLEVRYISGYKKSTLTLSFLQVISTSMLHQMHPRSIRNAFVASKTCIQRIAFALTSQYSTDGSHPCYLLLKYIRSTMAWGLEARVPFLDKTFLDVSMNVNPTEKMFSKGASQEVDKDGLPIMEKVQNCQLELFCACTYFVTRFLVYFEKGL